MTSCYRWLMLVLSMGVYAHAALADDTVTYSYHAWQVVCSQEHKHACVMVQRGLDSKSGKQVFQVALQYEGKASRPTLSILAPLGVALKSGLSVDVEGSSAKPYPMTYEICVPSGCLARSELDKQLGSAMQGGTIARIHVKDQAGKEIILPFSLKGYAKAFDRLRASH